MKTVELKAFRNLKLLPHRRKLLIRKNDCLFFGDMKDDPLFFYLSIAAEYLEILEQTQREPAFILRYVDVDVEVDKNRK